MRIHEIINVGKPKKKAPTITSATMKNGEINRDTANKILDPEGYFKPKAPSNTLKKF